MWSLRISCSPRWGSSNHIRYVRDAVGFHLGNNLVKAIPLENVRCDVDVGPSSTDVPNTTVSDPGGPLLIGARES